VASCSSAGLHQVPHTFQILWLVLGTLVQKIKSSSATAARRRLTTVTHCSMWDIPVFGVQMSGS
jgi:hypothetical protein